MVSINEQEFGSNKGIQLFQYRTNVKTQVKLKEK